MGWEAALVGIGAGVGGIANAYGGIESAKIMAEQQAAANQLAQQQFELAKKAAEEEKIAKADAQNSMEEGLGLAGLFAQQKKNPTQTTNPLSTGISNDMFSTGTPTQTMVV